jgi:hypothetical protein
VTGSSRLLKGRSLKAEGRMQKAETAEISVKSSFCLLHFAFCISGCEFLSNLLSLPHIVSKEDRA